MVVPPVWMFLISAAAAVVISVGILTYQEYQENQQRQRTSGRPPPKKERDTRKRGDLCTIDERNPPKNERYPPKKERDTRKRGDPCTICNDSNATVEFLPCGHMLMCRSCYRLCTQDKRLKKCIDINCREYIEDFKFFSHLE